jgi:hypothetical protein
MNFGNFLDDSPSPSHFRFRPILLYRGLGIKFQSHKRLGNYMFSGSAPLKIQSHKRFGSWRFSPEVGELKVWEPN